MSYSLKDDVAGDLSAFSGGGDGAVGKTCLLIRYANNSFPEDYVPILYENKHVYLNLWDTAGQEDYDRLRPLSYPETDVFFFCFDITNRNSLMNLRDRFYPEIQEHAPNTPIVLVGTKMDLEEDLGVIKEMKERGDTFCSKLEIVRVARDIKAFNYMETSAKTGKGVKEAFEEVLSITFRQKFVTKRKFIFFKKKVLNEAIMKDWSEMEKELKKEEVDRIKRYKKEIVDMRKEAKKEFQKAYCKLSHDIVLHILHEFVLMDFADVYEYQKRFLFYLEELDLKQERVFFHFFGYFPNTDKKMIQFFFNFKVYSEEQMQCLPKMKKVLMRKQSSALTVWRARNYYSGVVQFSHLTDVTMRDLKAATAKQKECLKSVSFVKIRKGNENLKDIGSVLKGCEDLKELQIFQNFKNAVPNYSYRLDLMCLNRLVISYAFSRDITFKNLENLEYLKIRGEYTHGFFSEEQLKSLTSLPKLREFYVYEMSFRPIGHLIYRLFDGNCPLERLVLNVQISLKFFEEVKIDPRKCRLKFLVIAFSVKHQPKEEVEYFPPAFQSVLTKAWEETKKDEREFDYYLKSSKEDISSFEGGRRVVHDFNSM